MYDLTKKNQDSFFTKEIVLENSGNCLFFGVCDGHGKNGDKISQFITKHLPLNLEKILKKNETEKKKKEKNSPIIKKNKKMENQLFLSLKKTVEELFATDLDTYFSGTTLNCLLIKNHTIYICNVGDSRAILSGGENFTKIHLLSTDHKPENILEKNRILKKNGRVQKMKNDKGEKVGPLRIWLPDENLPGLAMSRSIGDLIGSSIGITWRPNMQIKELCKGSKSILIIGSDGVWDVLSNFEVVEILKRYWGSWKGGEFLLKECVRMWKKTVDGICDDITFLVLFIEH